ADVLTFKFYLKGVRAQPAATTLRALSVSPVPAQEHAHVQLVFLSLQPGEETLDTGEFVGAFDDHLLLIRFQIAPSDVKGNAVFLGRLSQVGLQPAILWLGPGIDGAFSKSRRTVR